MVFKIPFFTDIEGFQPNDWSLELSTRKIPTSTFLIYSVDSP